MAHGTVLSILDALSSLGSEMRPLRKARCINLAALSDARGNFISYLRAIEHGTGFQPPHIRPANITPGHIKPGHIKPGHIRPARPYGLGQYVRDHSEIRGPGYHGTHAAAQTRIAPAGG